MKQDDIVITGLGAITASGHNVMDTWQAVKNGESGIAVNPKWDAQSPMSLLTAAIKNAQPRKLIRDRKLLKLLSPFDVFGINAADQAIADSGLIEFRETLSNADDFNDRTGVYVGSPGNKYFQQYDFLPVFQRAEGDMQDFAKALPEEVHPMWLLKILPNNVLAYVGIQNGFKGANENITNHGVSGAQAIVEAMHAIWRGDLDRAIVVAYESNCELQSQLYYDGLGLLTHQALRAFSAQHDGTVLAEAGAAIVLEKGDSARARSANIYGRILGGATRSEAQGIFPIAEDGDGVRRAMQAALDVAKLTADDIGMVCAHANGVAHSDNSEAQAITDVFGANAIPVTGFKWSTGHTITAAGVLETILTVLALAENQVPAIPHLSKLAKECQQLQAGDKASMPRSPTAIINTRAFASLNTSLLVAAA